MDIILKAIPLLPLSSAICLLLFQPQIGWIRVLGVGSVTLSALLTLTLNVMLWEHELFIVQAQLGEWLNLDLLTFRFGLYLDPLSLVMLTIITCIGTLIHLYSASYMIDDSHQCRFFAYLNLFVSAMLFLVLADNLILLYLGWEGVGLCSYLLIGFWYKKTVNNQAANKAFIITRIGDTAMLIGIIILFYQFNSLNIQQIQIESQLISQQADLPNSTLINLACLLLFAGAAGKSAQAPLHSWLPDAMAGPTPVSALIHAATMVTAGIYLVARNDALYQLSPHVLTVIAFTGVFTLLLGATSALCQSDLKRILAYSTISQLGYMFLALGVGSVSSAVFHLMTHAFFKALLFLSAGALIYCMNHEQDITKMGGLRQRLPLLATSFAIGCAALASLPMTSGFFSKELILEQVALSHQSILWWCALLGAFFTALYSAKLFLLIFCGPQKLTPTHSTPIVMGSVLIILMTLSLLGGIQPTGVSHLFNEFGMSGSGTLSPLQHWLPIILPIATILLAWWLFKKGLFTTTNNSGQSTNTIVVFLRSGWGFDALYNTLIIQPFRNITYANRHDLIDSAYTAMERFSHQLHLLLNQLQTGKLRSYSASLVIFCAVVIAWGLIR
ncbi:NADH-quinone oxidoreductase subunit L [Shewanella sp. UCD-KL12]|uniref:NADH-quinone oxidoreductase subunit L n=1 Tax=Shewanella sp. UCD-KL12 TaxID=1917163 RepID=UPI0009710E65|nr:NADH-quinone oxidoreductase subunit L [Shewanella sp. UCD-KL12]